MLGIRESVRPKDLARLCAATLAGSALVLHVGALVIFSMPDNPIRRALPSAVGYVARFFGQDFGRATPDPTLDGLRLSIACTASGGATTGWIDPLAEVPSRRVAAVVDDVSHAYARAFTRAFEAGCPDAPDGTAAANQLRCAQARLRETDASVDALRLARTTCARVGVDEPSTIHMRLARLEPVSWADRADVTTRAWTPAEAFQLDEVVVR